MNIEIKKRRLYKSLMKLFDKIRDIDFESSESIEDLNLDESTSEQYVPTKTFELKRVISDLDISPNSVAIDFGSGKGKVLLHLSQIDEISMVYGVELSKYLVDISNDNIAKLNVKNIEVINCDARHLPTDILDKITLIYMFNPFPKVVFEEVFNNIIYSLTIRNPRNMVIIYHNPLYSDIIKKNKHFSHFKDYDNQISRCITSVFISKAIGEKVVA
tara:strand:+ start:859 stop:1506 length:648 start_codon:yes stop_codon:yes gene_type:complete